MTSARIRSDCDTHGSLYRRFAFRCLLAAPKYLEARGVKDVLDLLDDIELDVARLEGDSGDVLSTIDDEVGERRFGRVARRERERSDVADSLVEDGHEGGIVDLEHVRGKDTALPDVADAQAIFEGLHAELGEQGSLRRADL